MNENNNLKITFLGTGTSAGVPMIACDCYVCRSEDTWDKRLRSSVLISVGADNFVIDTGPDFRQQMLREKVKSLTAIVFTHEHKDHIAGMDDIRAFNFLTRKPVHVYVNDRTEVALRREFPYVFADMKYPGVPEVDLHKITNIPFTINNTKFIPVEVLHYKLPVFGYRVGGFTYITDANYISDEEKEKIKGSEVLVLNALRKEPHVSHFTLQEAIDLAQELKAEKTYFTHISHMLGTHEEIQKELPENIFLAYDGLKVEVGGGD